MTLASGPASTQDKQTKTTTTTEKKSDDDKSVDQSARIGGRTIHDKAIVGTIPMRDAKGE